jgi:para-nitrobenzyl esterase
MLRLTAALAALSIATGALAAEVVRTQSGAVSGVTADGVVSFKGLPYAAPPVGPLRWRPPQTPARWSGVRKADHVGPLCMQKIVKDNGVGPGPASEDCLNLDVYAPTGARHLPVMVWIHGGGFVNGSGTAALYDGSALARQGVVVVSIDYRLGRFGFFAHPALTAEQKGGPLANYGLLDEIAALRWVRRNIAAFGGDPAQVTIFGESAGGMAVNRLLMIADARGLFQRAIVESGAGSEHSQTLKEAEADGAKGAAKLTGKAEPTAADLRAIPAEKIIAAGDPQITDGELPIIDGRLLTEGPLKAFAAGRVARVPYLIGTNSLEFPPAFSEGLTEKIVHLTQEQTSAMEGVYGGAETFHAHMLSDVVFGAPGRRLAADMARLGGPVFLYRFSVVSAAAPKAVQGGAVHASDRQYVFKTLNASEWPTDVRDARLAETISAYWVAFARTGDPNGGGRPAWPRYGKDDRLLNFTNDGPVAEKTPDAAALDLVAAGLPVQ